VFGIDKLEDEVAQLKSHLSFREYILNEAKQVGNIYHFTTLTNILKIIKSGKIIKNNENYVSLTRDFQLPNENGYFNTGEYVVRITIDENRLSENIKIEPISDVLFNDEREEGVLNEIKTKYFKQIDFLITDNRVFPKDSITVIYEKCKTKLFKTVKTVKTVKTNLIKKYQPVKD